MSVREPGAVLERLPRSPAGAALLDLAGRHPGLWLVGGAVRDLLLGRHPRELDVVVEGPAEEPARELAAALDAPLTAHDSFGTVSVGSGVQRIDLAAARTEVYPQPGALPEVSPGTLDQDLQRRDFTVNAMAIALSGADPGALRTVPRALEDLHEGRLRVLHDASFIDDPTRLLRLARYAARLTFYPDEHTRLLAARAVSSGALTAVSGARVGAELRLALNEHNRLGTMDELARLGILRRLHMGLNWRRDLSASALALLPRDGRADLLLLATLLLPPVIDTQTARDVAIPTRDWLDRLEFPAGDRDLVIRSVEAVPELVQELSEAQRPSQIRAAAQGRPLEAVALAGALGPRQAAHRWLYELRHVRLQITGDDLLAAGVPFGPDVGRRLAAALDARLDGVLPQGRDAELAAALDA